MSANSAAERRIRPGRSRKKSPGWLKNVSRADHPVLSRLLKGPEGDVLLAELDAVFGNRVIQRAPRKRTMTIAQLTDGAQSKAVSIRDVSATGVRLSMRWDPNFKISYPQPLWLRVRVNLNGVKADHELPLSFVRVISRQGDAMDLAFRFEGLNSSTARLLEYLDNFVE